MGNWDDLEAELTGVELNQEAGEWAVIAMACVAFSDGHADESEVAKARELVSNTSVIRDSLGPPFGEQLFMDTIERLKGAPETELELLKGDLRDLAGRITEQEHRDHALQTLIAIAKADKKIDVAEYRLLKELKALIGSELMIPIPQIEV